MKVVYTDDRNEEHEFLIDEFKVAGIDFHTNDEDGKAVKFFLTSGKVITLYLGFSNVETWKQLRDYYYGKFIQCD